MDKNKFSLPEKNCFLVTVKKWADWAALMAADLLFPDTAAKIFAASLLGVKLDPEISAQSVSVIL